MPEFKNTSVSGLGGWLQLGSLTVAQIYSRACYDWYCLDLEHGVFSDDNLAASISILKGSGKTVLVRAKHLDEMSLRIPLDLGADGLIIPKVESLTDVEQILKWTRYPPEGERGIGFSVGNYFNSLLLDSSVNSNTFPKIGIIIESVGGVETLEDILRHKRDHIEFVFVGPYDLSGSAGCVGDFENPIMTKLLKKISAVASAYSVAIGIHSIAPELEAASALLRRGYSVVAHSTDSHILSRSVAQINL